MKICNATSACEESTFRTHDVCILHLKDPDKPQDIFIETYKDRREKVGDEFQKYFFPIEGKFIENEFDSEADFSFCTFSQGAFFREATFKGDADFVGAKFLNSADFYKAKFEGKARFNLSKFKESADFREARFQQSFTSFNGVDFHGETNFTDAVFSGKTNFSKICAKKISFTRTHFREYVSFSESFLPTQEIRTERVSFAGSNFHGGGHISTVRVGETIFSGVEVDFRGTSIENSNFTFSNVDLSSCLVENANIRNMNFRNVNWVKIDTFWLYDTRNGIYDEEILYTDKDVNSHFVTTSRNFEQSGLKGPIHAIEIAYRELKQNYENQRDFVQGGDFHIGEKEMKLLNPRTSIEQQLLLKLYKFSSYFGERATLPIFWFLVLVFSSQFLYLSAGITSGDTQYSICKCDMTFESLTVFFESFVYSLRQSLLLGSSEFLYSDQNLFVRFINTIQKIISPILIALIAFAVRQRVKR